MGFRFFVEDRARRLDLEGFVRNLSDGRTVEVIAEGPRDRLEMLLAHLQRGPSLARVEHADEAWLAATGQYQGFEIR